MNCPSEAQLERYAGGHLPSGEAWETGAHLDACAECRETVAALREVDSWLDLLDVAEARGDHLGDEALAALAAGGKATRDALAHLGRCEECAAVLGTLRHELVEAREAPATAAASRPRTYRLWAGLSAAAAVLIVTGTLLLTHPSGVPPIASAPAGMTSDRAVLGGAPGAASEKALAMAPPAPAAVTAPGRPAPAVSRRPSRPRAERPRAPRRPVESLDGQQLAMAPPPPPAPGMPAPPQIQDMVASPKFGGEATPPTMGLKAAAADFGSAMRGAPEGIAAVPGMASGSRPMGFGAAAGAPGAPMAGGAMGMGTGIGGPGFPGAVAAEAVGTLTDANRLAGRADLADGPNLRRTAPTKPSASMDTTATAAWRMVIAVREALATANGRVKDRLKQVQAWSGSD